MFSKERSLTDQSAIENLRSGTSKSGSLQLNLWSEANLRTASRNSYGKHCVVLSFSRELVEAWTDLGERGASVTCSQSQIKFNVIGHDLGVSERRFLPNHSELPGSQISAHLWWRRYKSPVAEILKKLDGLRFKMGDAYWTEFESGLSLHKELAKEVKNMIKNMTKVFRKMHNDTVCFILVGNPIGLWFSHWVPMLNFETGFEVHLLQTTLTFCHS